MRPTNPDHQFGRIESLVNVDALQEASVAIVGLGSAGNPIAACLARQGVGQFLLIDGDTVERSNLARTCYVHSDIGRPKADATADLLRAINPRLSCSAHAIDLTTTNLTNMASLLQRYDLIVLAADSFDLMIQLSDLVYHNSPVALVAFGPRVDYAEVGFSLPGRTPPLQQLFGQRKRTAMTRPQGLGSDTAFVTSYVSTLCLSLLLRNTTGRELLPISTNHPLHILGLRRTWLFENVPTDFVRSVIQVHTST